jgi:hypothetical protein
MAKRYAIYLTKSERDGAIMALTSYVEEPFDDAAIRAAGKALNKIRAAKAIEAPTPKGDTDHER